MSSNLKNTEVSATNILFSKKMILGISDELGYLVDAIVSDDMIDSFDKRPNDMSIEVRF